MTDGLANDPPDGLVQRPAQGRVFDARRRVRLGDCAPHGRLRLDACARYLQDIANDDSRDAGSPNPTAWVARRTVIRVVHFHEYLDMTALSTWCSGLGPRWAERRYSVHSDAPGAGRIESSTLWVHIDMATMRPIPVPEGFAEQFATAAAGRTVKARLHLPLRPPPADAGQDAGQDDEHDAGQDGGPDRTALWPLRFVDFDILGHVNNAVYWAMVEEELAAQRERGRLTGTPLTVTLEHHDGIERADSLEIVVRDRANGFYLWVTTTAGKVTAVVRAVASSASLD